MARLETKVNDRRLLALIHQMLKAKVVMPDGVVASRTSPSGRTAGATPVALQSVATAPKRGFETSIRIPTGQAYVAVQALDSAGHALSTSSTVKAG